MNTLAPTIALASMPMPAPALHALAGQAGNMPPTRRTHLTRVSLAYVERRINLYLRFGHPARIIELDRWRRVAVFVPDAVFCRIRWEANDHGTVRWQLMVLQAGTSLDVVQRIAGILPGARILLRAEGEQQAKAVLQRIDGIEALGIDPAHASPAYWGTLGNRLFARLPLPDYSMERHAAWLAGRALQ